MTKQERDEIAQLFNDALSQHQCNCPLGFDADVAQELRSFAAAIKAGKKTALKAFITLLVGAVAYSLYEGIKFFFNK